jgi:hypothetical protein
MRIGIMHSIAKLFYPVQLGERMATWLAIHLATLSEHLTHRNNSRCDQMAKVNSAPGQPYSNKQSAPGWIRRRPCRDIDSNSSFTGI